MKDGGTHSVQRPRRHGSPGRRRLAGAAVLVLTGTLLSACGGEGKPTLNWYINPDGQTTLNALAERCSTDEYDIAIQLLPASATDQRTQLARRLAAEDSSTDLMSLDPVFVPEFANAGWLAEFDGDAAGQIVDDDVLAGSAETVKWDDGVYAVPQWANTQVLWYRRSLAEAAGLQIGPDNPVTWDQVIDAAADQGATVGVQANRYEAYVVWIIQGAGGNIINPDTAEDGRDAEVTIDSEAGAKAAAIIQKLADSGAAQPDFTTSNEGTSLGAMFPDGGGPGEFMVNWTFVYKNYADLLGQPGGPTDEQQLEDLGWARYPQTVEGEESKPPIGGIDIGVGAYSEHVDWAKEAAQCVADPQAQLDLAVNEGLMPSRASVYEEQELRDAYPTDLLDLWRQSIDSGGPRPKSAFYSQISNAVQSRWHSPTSVDPGSTPEESAKFLRDVLSGKALL